MAGRSHFYPGHGGIRLHAAEYGPSGDPRLTVICIPGLTRNARDFEQIAQRLAGQHRIFCLDLRGRGKSDHAADPMTYVPLTYVQDLECFFAHFGIGSAVLLGTSLGALVATIHAALFPQRIVGLMFNDSGPEIDPKGLSRIGSYVGQSLAAASWAEAAALVREQDAIVYPQLDEDGWLRFARRRFAPDASGTLRPEYDPRIALPFRSPATTPDQWPYLKQLAGIPGLLLRGAHSDILAAATIPRMQAAMPSLQAAEVPGCGHAPSLDEPAAVAAIEAFLGTLPASIDDAERDRRTAAAARFVAGV